MRESFARPAISPAVPTQHADPRVSLERSRPMITKIVEAVAMVTALLLGLIKSVEEPGNGAAKKQAVVADALTLIQSLPIPGLVKLVLANTTVLGILVDNLVKMLNNTGWFAREGSAVAAAPKSVPAPAG